MCHDHLIDYKSIEKASLDVYEECLNARRNGGWNIDDLIDTIDKIEGLLSRTKDLLATESLNRTKDILVWKLMNNRMEIIN